MDRAAGFIHQLLFCGPDLPGPQGCFCRDRTTRFEKSIVVAGVKPPRYQVSWRGRRFGPRLGDTGDDCDPAAGHACQRKQFDQWSSAPLPDARNCSTGFTDASGASSNGTWPTSGSATRVA